MNAKLPLSNVRVLELTHMVMGPTVGLILADLGAEVIKIEPLAGDNTRRLGGSGAGYFSMYNRNKRTISLDLKSEAGQKVVHKLLANTDVLIENFRPGGMAKYGLDYESLEPQYPNLIYCSLKGFLSGPYENRTALDEVTQMMGGLAYMTGTPEKPMRAGASVVDVGGGMFGVIGILSALEQRHHTGKGQKVTSSLFETTAFFVGQHMAQQASLGEAPPPMSVRRSAWAVYDIFNTKDSKPIFVGVVSDTQWRKFCETFNLVEFREDELLQTNNGRVQQRDRLMPTITTLFSGFTQAELIERLEACGLPFAPINKPGDLFDDPHLNASQGLLDVTLTEGENAGLTTKLPALPVQMSGIVTEQESQRAPLRYDLPKHAQHTKSILMEAGYSDEEVSELVEAGIVNVDQEG